MPPYYQLLRDAIALAILIRGFPLDKIYAAADLVLDQRDQEPEDTDKK